MWSGDYEFVCIVKDKWLDLSTTHTFTMSVIIKPDLIVTGGPSSGSTRLPQEYVENLSGFSSCPWNLPYSKTLYVNNT
jgi:hypothetical protein